MTLPQLLRIICHALGNYLHRMIRCQRKILKATLQSRFKIFTGLFVCAVVLGFISSLVIILLRNREWIALDLELAIDPLPQGGILDTMIF